MSREEGFDRERILEWLLNVPSDADPHQPSSELDRGSTFDPDSIPASAPPTPASQQHHHHHQQQQQQNKPQKLHHRMTSPLIQRHQQRRMPSPVVLTSLTQHGTERALSLGSLPVSERRSRDGKMNVTFTQSRDHLASFLRKKKSGSPLPDTHKDPELPIFTPRPPSLPGTRTLVKQTSRSDASVADHLLRTSPTSLKATLEEQSTSQSTCTKEGVDDSPLPPCFSGRQEQPPRFTTHTTDCEDEDNSKIHQHSLLDSYRTDSTSGSHSTHYDCVSAVTEYVAPPIEDLVLATPSTIPLGNREEGEGEEREEEEGEGEEEEEEEEGERERCAPLSSVELATLSLHVIDILPQLAVYLSMDYSQYEHIISSESSPQRQSMAVLMAWYRSGTRRRGRWELARALQQFGEEYSRTAQLLLRGELEESGHTLQDLEGWSSSRRSVSSSTSPTPAPHHPCSPSPLPPRPTSTSHLSPEHKPHTVPPSSSPSPSPHHPLSTQARKLKQGFTFDEDQVSHDPLPKFLSSRTLQSSSSDSPHHQSPLLPHSHMLHSLPIQHQTSLSEVRSVSSTSLPPPAPRLPGHTPRVLTSSRRTISLQNDDMLQFGGRSRRELRGSYSSGRLHRSSLQSVDISREVDSSIQCESTGNIVRESSGREEMMMKSQVGSAEMGRECSGGILRPADSHCVESGTHSSEPLESQQSFAIGSQTLAKHTVQQPRTNPGSRHLSVIGSQLPLPMSSTSSPNRKSGVGKARLQETAAVAGTVIKQEVWSPTLRGDGGSTRQKMKRQDSGIETLAST